MKKLVFVALIIALALVISQDTYASPILSGISYYSVPGKWTATVNWEVYAPGDTSSYLTADSDYHYFYYVTNTSPAGGSSLKTFTVGNPALAPINSSGSIDRGAGTPAPSVVTVFSDSVAYYFLTDIIDPGESTDWLYYTSPWEPGMVDGGLINGGTTEDRKVPGPVVPEPASAALLGMSLVGLIGRSVRRRFKA